MAWRTNMRSVFLAGALLVTLVTAGCTANNAFYNCGNEGGKCCVDGTCKAGASCRQGTCVQCGSAGQACCGGGQCGNGQACANGLCAACGGPGQPCCPGNSCSGGGCCVRDV